MVLRKELEPPLAVVEQRYPHVLRLLDEYEAASDGSDEEGAQAVVEQLQKLTGKPITEADLVEYYEEGSKEELAIRLALPAPQPGPPLTPIELLEILRRLSNSATFVQPWEELTFAEQAQLYLHNYYHELLKLHFPGTYQYKYFIRQRRPDGSYYELTSEERAARLLA